MIVSNALLYANLDEKGLSRCFVQKQNVWSHDANFYSYKTQELFWNNNY